MVDVLFYLCYLYLKKFCVIFDDLEVIDNDCFVVYNFLQNVIIVVEGQFLFCQDIGMVIVVGKKGEDVYIGVNDVEWIFKGIYNIYQKWNLWFLQVVLLIMFDEKNLGINFFV